MQLSEQELIRRATLQELLQQGIEPDPAESFDVNAKAAEILTNFPNNNALYQEVSIAGRIMGRRIMGAASFVELLDSTGRIQPPVS